MGFKYLFCGSVPELLLNKPVQEIGLPVKANCRRHLHFNAGQEIEGTLWELVFIFSEGQKLTYLPVNKRFRFPMLSFFFIG